MRVMGAGLPHLTLRAVPLLPMREERERKDAQTYTDSMGGNATVVFPGKRQVEVVDRERPAPGPGELLVRTRRSLVSTGTELTILGGEYPPNGNWAGYGKYPFTAGYSNVGVVEAAGEGVDAAWKGRRVASFAPHAAWVTVPAAQASPVPDEVGDEDAAFYAIALIVMNGVRLAQVKLGEAVVVFGLGLLGQFAVRFCHLSGARPVVGLDVAPARLALLPALPGLVALDSREPGALDRAKAASAGRLADVVFEVTGNPDLIPGQFAALKNQGRYIVLSSPRGPSTLDFHDVVNARSIVIIGAHQMSTPQHETPYNPWTRQRNIELFFDLVRRGEFACAPLVSHRVPASQAPDLYRMLLQDRSGAMGCLLTWP